MAIISEPVLEQVSDALEETPSSQFSFLRNWWPISRSEALDVDRPNAVTILGQRLVVWHHKDQGWRVLDDRCPHRETPLSEGRICAGGTRLMCSYHGWQFDEQGACSCIPQITGEKAAKIACGSTASRARTYPAVVKSGLLWVWMDISKEGLLASTEVPPYLPPGYEDVKTWFTTQLPVDWSVMMEQQFDVTHAPFLHHGLAHFRMQDSVPMEADTPHIDVLSGIRWTHKGYLTSEKNMRAEREFQPPCQFRVQYLKENGAAFNACLLNVPVRPGLTRQFVSFSSQPPPSSGAAPAPPLAQRLRGLLDWRGLLTRVVRRVLPESAVWAQHASGYGVPDQDIMALPYTQSGVTWTPPRNRYKLFAEGDRGIMAMNRWMALAGYQHLWQQQHAAGATDALPRPRLSPRELLDRRWHVDACKDCQKGLVVVTRACYALLAAAAVAAMAAVHNFAFWVPTPLAAWPLAWAAVWAAISAGLLRGLAQLWEWREYAFVSGYPHWRKVGGLSLVERKL